MNFTQPLYLDYAATTPCDLEVADAMQKHLTLNGNFANSGSRTHIYGWQAENSVEKARNQIAKVLNSDVTEIIFTSGATESNNLALINSPAGEIISSTIEHSAILQVLQNLEKKAKHKISLLSPSVKGKISLKQLEESINKNTKMVSLMAINNEIGSLNPIYEIGDFLAEKNILFHIDAAQAFGKIKLDMKELKADLLSICAHKIYGPKGIGALFVRNSIKDKMNSLIFGGSQELGLRGGTLAVHQIVGFGLAAELAQQNMDKDFENLKALREIFLAQLTDISFFENGASCDKFPAIVNLTFPNLSNETLINSLPELAFSLGSACKAGDIKASEVLLKIGLSEDLALNSARFSFGRFTKLEEAKQAGILLQKAVKSLQKVV